MTDTMPQVTSTMAELETVFQQVRTFVVDHTPEAVMDQTVGIAIAILGGGILVSVFGAKLARFGMAGVWGVVGGFGGAFFASRVGYPAILCVSAGILALATVGYQTYKFWVGALTGVVLCTAVLGVFGYNKVLPHLPEFEQPQLAAVDSSVVDGSDETVAFSIPTPEAQQAYAAPEPTQWASDFWGFVSAREPGVERNAWALGILALVSGLCAGVLATRTAAIVATSMVGTGMVTSSAGALFTRFAPDASYQALHGHPGLMGMVAGAFLVSSLIVQTMITRNPKAAKAKADG